MGVERPTERGKLTVVRPEHALPGEARVLEAAQRSLRGERRGPRALWPFLGPAFIAAVAYVDPGNFATNMAGGAKFGYLLLWVILTANLMAMLVQSMSAKLGIATGQNLPEVCRDRFPRPVTWALWIQAEVIAMATDLAEILGAALGIYLLFDLPLFAAGLVAGAAAFAILALQARGFRRLEAVIAGFVGVIMLSFGAQVFIADPSPTGALHGLVPGFSGSESVLLAVGILGATVMPHVIYLHSALTQHRIVGADEEARRRIFRFEQIDVVIAMGFAGAINMAMLLIAAAPSTTAACSRSETTSTTSSTRSAAPRRPGGHPLRDRPARLRPLLLERRHARRSGRDAGLHPPPDPALPAARGDDGFPRFVVLAVGLDPSRSLVLSQVVLSFGIPFALIPLLLFCRDRGLMGSLVNRAPRRPSPSSSRA